MENDRVTLVVDSKKFNFSRKKLSERSIYFNIMFNSDFAEKNKSVIELKGITALSLEQIIYYLKHGQIMRRSRLTVKELLALLEAATMFQFSDLQELVSKAIYQCLDVSNTFDILEVASRLDATKLIQRARAIALWMFDDITKMDPFFRLKADQVEGYISDRALHSMLGELGVWEAIDRWINCGSDELPQYRVVHLPRLIKCLCLKSLDWRDLKLILCYDSVSACPLVTSAIGRIIKEKMAKERDKDANFEIELENESLEVMKFIADWEKTEPRKLPLVPSVVGNIRMGPEAVSPCIFKFCEIDRRYIPVLRLTKLENTLGSMVGFKVVAHGSKLYMVGGEMMTRQHTWNHAVWVYDQIFGSWTFLANLLKPSRHISACCSGDHLYILGGFGRHRVLQDSVYKFSIRDGTWQICAPLPRAMYSVACCFFRGFIYIFESYIYQYIPSTDIWVKLLTSPLSKGFTSAMPDDNFIYLAGAYTRSVYRFNPSMPHKKLELIGNFKNECVQACLIDGHVYSLSQDEFGEEICCEKINVTTGERTILFEGMTDTKLVDLNPRHHHGCFPLLLY